MRVEQRKRKRMKGGEKRSEGERNGKEEEGE